MADRFKMRSPMHRVCPAVAVFAILAAASCCAGAEDDAPQVASIFERRCLSCHNSAEKKGGLSLATAKDMLAGGESGAILVSGKPAESLLLDFVTGEKPEMPKSG